MILLTLANSRTGRHIIPFLAQRGDKVRGVDISPAAEGLKALGVEEVVVGDLADKKMLAGAFEGVDAVVHIGPPLDSNEFIAGKLVIDAAQAARVRHFVYVSVIHPEIDSLLNHRAKRLVQEYLLNARLDWTILQPQHYMQGVNVPQVVADGCFAMPYAMETPLAHVDMKDLAEVVAKVLAEGEKHFYATYEICGADVLSGNEIAHMVSEQAGKPIAARRIPFDEFVKFISSHVPPGVEFPEYSIYAFERLFNYYSRYGIQGNPNVLTWLLGRKPTTMKEYIARCLKEMA